MIDKLIQKVVEDAEKTAREIIEKAEQELHQLFAKEKEKIDKEYEEKLRSEKERIDREYERKISSFRMEKEKELLALRNGFIEEVMKNLEERFNSSLNEDIWDVVASFCRDIKNKNCTVIVPESAGDVEVPGLKIVKDRNLKNGFIVSAERWKVVFNWNRIMSTMGDELREKAGRYFSAGNG